MARALVDGIVLETRRCLQVLDQAGLPHGTVRVAGGSGADPDFRRQLADACTARGRLRGIEARASTRPIGAAALAAAAVGHGRPAAPPATVEALMPDEPRARVWDELWQRHEAALRAVRAAGVGGPSQERTRT